MRAFVAVLIALGACGDDGGPGGLQLERVNMVAQDPIVDMDVAADGTIYILTRRSVGPTEIGVSRDLGRTWSLRTTNGVQVSDLEVIGNTMIAVSDHGLVRYTNLSEAVWAAEVYPSTFAYPYYERLYDGMTLVEGRDGRVFALRHFYGPSPIYLPSQLYHTTDDGITWTPIANPHLLDRIGIGHDGHIYGGNAAREVYRSTNLGVDWTLLGMFAYPANRLFATTNGSVYVSLENAQCLNAPDGVTFVTVAFCPEFEADGVVYANRPALITGEAPRLWRSRDGFVTHDETRMPIDTAPTGQYVANGTHLFVKARAPMYLAQGTEQVHPLNLDSYGGSLFIEASGHYWAVNGSSVIIRDPESEVWTYVIDAPRPPVAEFSDGMLVFEGFTSADRGVTRSPTGALPFAIGPLDVVRFSVAPDDALHVSVAHYFDGGSAAIWTHTERAASFDRGASWTLQTPDVLVTYIHPRTGDLFGVQGDPARRETVRSHDSGLTWAGTARVLVDYDRASETELWQQQSGGSSTWWLDDSNGRDRTLSFALAEFETVSEVVIDRDRLVVKVNSSDLRYAYSVDPY